jgi:hypothetical protein
VQTEADPLDPNDPAAALRTVQAGYLYLERAVTTIEWGEGLVLRWGASNEKAKRELGWQPRYASWRQGFAQGLG